MRIAMLMPNPPSIVCGIADHSVLLGRALQKLGSEVDYLALNCHDNGTDDFDIHCWDGSAKGLSRLIRNLGTDVLWVQYSGYGYSRKGVPFRLARALGEVRARVGAPLLTICMHETHAELARLGWRGSLLERLQRSTSGRVARSGDIVFATVKVNLDRCVDDYGVSRSRISLLPVASNIPDVETMTTDRLDLRRKLNLPESARIAAIFGLWPTQSRTYELFKKELENAFRMRRIDHVLAIGGGGKRCPDDALSSGENSPNGHLTVLGPASAMEIAKTLRCCDVGLVSTPPDYLGKSGVAAAFAAANLELWMKNEQSEVVVEKHPAPVPKWDELAYLAKEKILNHLNGSKRISR